MAIATIPAKIDPPLEVATGPATAEAPAASEPARETPRIEQLARIEDKVARIEEKFARAEERMMRVEGALERATHRLEGASNDMNLQGVKDDIAAMRSQVAKKPGAASIFIITLFTAIVAAALGFAAARFGIPGILPR